jgi:hypothetical protein
VIQKQIYVQHTNTEAYKELTEDEATEMNVETKRLIRKIFNEKCGLPSRVYLSWRLIQSCQQNTSTVPGAKLHNSPLKWQPTIEHHLTHIIKSSPTFLRDPQQVVDELDAMGTLLLHVRLFTSDATAMHKNIEPSVGIAVIKEYI